MSLHVMKTSCCKNSAGEDLLISLEAKIRKSWSERPTAISILTAGKVGSTSGAKKHRLEINGLKMENNRLNFY